MEQEKQFGPRFASARIFPHFEQRRFSAGHSSLPWFNLSPLESKKSILKPLYMGKSVKFAPETVKADAQVFSCDVEEFGYFFAVHSHS
jgi:hypothetical protein